MLWPPSSAEDRWGCREAKAGSVGEYAEMNTEGTCREEGQGSTAEETMAQNLMTPSQHWNLDRFDPVNR